MRWLMILGVLLSGCAAGYVSREYPATEPPMMSCHAGYVSWFKDQSAFDASVCDASVKVKKAEAKTDLFEALLRNKLVR